MFKHNIPLLHLALFKDIIRILFNDDAIIDIYIDGIKRGLV